MAAPILIFEGCEIPGTLRVSGVLLGETQKGREIPLPVSPDGACYVEYFPLQSGYAPMLRALYFQDGRIVPPYPENGMQLTSYPGNAVVVRLRPQPLPEQTPCFLARALDHAVWQAHGESFKATLFMDTQLRLLIESDVQDDILLYTFPVPNTRAALELVTLQRQHLLFVSEKENDPGFLAVFCEREGKVQTLHMATADHFSFAREDLELCTISKLGDTRGHEVRKIFRVRDNSLVLRNEEIGFFMNDPVWLSTPEQAVSALLDALEMRLSEQALALLSAELKSDLSFDDLVSFIGPFDEWAPPALDVLGDNTVALIQSEGILQTARLMCFDVSVQPNPLGDYTVFNIRDY